MFKCNVWQDYMTLFAQCFCNLRRLQKDCVAKLFYLWHHCKSAGAQFWLKIVDGDRHKNFNMARSSVQNIIMKHRDTGLLVNKSGCDKKKLFSQQDEQMLIRMVKNYPKIRTAVRKNSLTVIRVHASKSMVTQTINRDGLKVCHLWKMSLMKKKHLIACLKFVSDFLKKPEHFLHCVLWSEKKKQTWVIWIQW